MAASALVLVVLAFSCASVRGDDPACPGGVCPGLGNLFYLPGVDALSTLEGGRTFVVEASVGQCARISDDFKITKVFHNQSSMQSLVKDVNTQWNLNGSIPIKEFTVGFSLGITTKSDSSSMSRFQSAQMDITATTRVAALLQTDSCLGVANFDAGYLRSLEALPLSGGLTRYESFLKDEGSHVMMEQSLGSRFQQWESSNSSSSEALKLLQVKACLSVEGMGGHGWSVGACGSYSSYEKKQAQKSSSYSQTVILGGTWATIVPLYMNMCNETMDQFLASAPQAVSAIAYQFKPVWEILIPLYAGRCKATGARSDCENAKRASNLQAAYGQLAAKSGASESAVSEILL